MGEEGARSSPAGFKGSNPAAACAALEVSATGGRFGASETATWVGRSLIDAERGDLAGGARDSGDGIDPPPREVGVLGLGALDFLLRWLPPLPLGEDASEGEAGEEAEVGDLGNGAAPLRSMRASSDGFSVAGDLVLLTGESGRLLIELVRPLPRPRPRPPRLLDDPRPRGPPPLCEESGLVDITTLMRVCAYKNDESYHQLWTRYRRCLDVRLGNKVTRESKSS